MKKIYFLLFFFVFVSAQAQIINIPDANFKAKLLASTYNDYPVYYYIAADINEVDMVVDTNGNGEIEVSEAQNVYYLTVQGANITDLTGIEYFTNLIELNCADNALTSLDVSALVNLFDFRCDRNNLSSLNISGLSNMWAFYYGGNNLPNVDASSNTQLRILSCGNNQITNLDVSPFPYLSFLICYYNQLTALDVSNNIWLQSLFCDNNLLTDLDLSSMVNFISLHANDNPLVYLNMKSGHSFTSNDMSMYNTNLSNCATLKYICVDDFNIASFQNKLNGYGYTNCNLNTYCSFIPGGTFYNMHGKAKLDTQNGEGCDANDPAVPNLKFSITNGITSGSFISDGTGNYQFPLQNGNYTIMPILENPDYFNIWPESIVVSLPTDANQMIKDFCLTPKEQHQDLEIIIIPATNARPGFDVSYKIIYKNKGNTIVSGDINFEFFDSMMDFINAVPEADSQTLNRLRFNYLDLLPFEKREILVSFNLNSPMETPAVVDGTILSFTASILPVINDEYVPDNNFSLKHTVVNSFDPNDKTCLEGTTITPEMAGKYVHYKIRFENT